MALEEENGTVAIEPSLAASTNTNGLSNRGNKLTGPENPSSKRPRIWKSLEVNETSIDPDSADLENFEKMFMRKVKFNNNEDYGNVFVKFLNEFEAQSALFSKEDIKLEKIFKEENLALRPLSRYTVRALQNRHLEVLTTLLMLKIEEEQEEYRKLMRLAEELCIEDFTSGGDLGAERVNDNVELNKTNTTINTTNNWINQIDSDLLLKLKALCHEHLHLKRAYISSLRRIRSAAVYSLFQAHNIYRQLTRLDRKLGLLRSKNENEEESTEEEK